MKTFRFSAWASLWVAIIFTLWSAPAAQAQTTALGLTVTADHSPAKPGEVVNYTFTIVNKSATTAIAGYGVDIMWTTPNFVSDSTPGSAHYVSYVNLAPGQSYSFLQAYKVDAGSVSDGRPAPTDGSVMILNASAYLDSNKTSGATANAQTIIQNAPTLSVDVADDAGGSVAPGQAITYTVTASNRGSSTVGNAQLSVPVPANATYLSASDGGTVSTSAVRWSVGALAPGAVVTRRCTFQAGVTPDLIVTQAQASDLANGNNQAASTISTVVRAAPALGFTVTADHSPVKPGEVVNYTFTISNPGTVAITNYGIDVAWLTPNFVSSATPGGYHYVSYVNLAPGQSYSFVQSYKVDPGSVNAGTLAPADGSILSLEAIANSDSGNHYGAKASAAVIVDGTPTLSVDVADDASGSAAPGQAVTYTLTASNRGSSTVGSAQLSAPLPAGTTVFSASDAGAVADGKVQWALGSLAPGAVVTRRYTLQAGGAAGQILARAEVVDTANLLNQAACTVATTVRSATALSLTVTADHSPVKPGEVVNYTFTISNPGTVAITNYGIDVAWLVPNFVSSATPGDYRYISYVNLAPGQGYSFTQAYKVDAGSASAGTLAPADGSVLRLEAIANSDSGNHYGAKASAAVVVDNTPTLSVDVADDAGGSVPPGQVITYTVAASNRGAAAVANAQLSVPVPFGTSVAAASDGGAMSDGAVKWPLGALAPGAFVTRTVSVNAGSNAAGSLILARAEAVDLGNPVNQATGTLSTLVRALPLVGLTVTADHNPVRPGEAVNYTFTLTNLGTTSFGSYGVDVAWTVPNFVSSATPGSNDYRSYLDVAPGQSYSFIKAYTVDEGSASAGTLAPADGSILQLEAVVNSDSGNHYGAKATAAVVVRSIAAPVIGVAGGTVNAQVGQAFSYQIQASNAATVFAASGLPGGLNINTATGLISGTPTVAGSFNVALGATNTGGTGSATLTINVIPASPTITVVGGTVSGKVGEPLNYQIQASNLPATFAASGLPGGLSVNAATGLISGTPTLAGTFNVSISATNPGGTGMTTLTFNIASALPTVTLAAAVPQIVAGTGQNGAFLLTRTGDLSQDLIVAYQVKGSAVNGVDYVYLKGFTKIKAGKGSKQLKVKPYGYGRGPGGKAVVRMVLLPGDAYTVGTPSTEKIKVKIIGQ